LCATKGIGSVNVQEFVIATKVFQCYYCWLNPIKKYPRDREKIPAPNKQFFK